jgi:hypothetical protein
MDIDRAIYVAELWEAGKMIGGDEDEVRNALLGEVKRLRICNKELHKNMVRIIESSTMRLIYVKD